MPKVTDPRLLQQLGGRAIPLPALPPEPPSGYGVPGNATPIVALPGGPADPAYVTVIESARANASQAARVAAERKIIEMQKAAQFKLWQQEHPELAAPPQVASGLTGAELLKSLPARDAATVQALTDGRMAFPAGAAIRSPYWQNMLALVAQYDPQFDAVNYNARAKTRQDFMSGPSARNIKALNTAIGHLGQLNSQIAGTASHGGFPFATTVNAVENAYLRGEGDTGPTSFDQTSSALASELTQVFRGSGGAEADVKRYVSELSPNASEAQKKAAVANIAGLLRSRLEAIGDQYRQGMGKTIDPLTLLNPHAQQAFQAILPESDDGSPPTSAAGGAPSRGPQGGGNGPPGPQDNAPIPLYASSPPPAAALASGATRTVLERNPVMDTVGKMVNSGANGAQIRAFLTKAGIDPTTVKGIDEAVRFHKRYPNTKSDAYTERVVPTTRLNRFMGSRAGAVVGAAADGLTAGLTDEFTGGLNSLITGQPLSDSIASANASKQLAFNTYPGPSLLGAAGGNVAGTFLGGALLKGTAPVLALGKYAPVAGDVAFNAASGAGQSNDNRLLGASLGAALGVAGRYAGQAAAVPAGALLRTRPGAAAVDFARGMFGANPLNRVPALSPAQKAAAAAIEKASPQGIGDALNEASGLGLPMTLADTHPELRALAGAAVRRSPTASQMAERVLIPRNRGQIDRFGAAVSRDLGPTANIPQLSADLQQQARTAAGPLYDNFYASPALGSPELESLLQTPAGQQSLARARTIAANERRDPMNLGFSLDAQGNVSLNPVRADLYSAQATARSNLQEAQLALKAARSPR